MYATHPVMVIDPGAIYGKPMSKQKKVMGRILICTDRQTDRRTDGQTYRQSDSYLPPLTSFLRIAQFSLSDCNSFPRFTQLVLSDCNSWTAIYTTCSLGLLVSSIFTNRFLGLQFVPLFCTICF